MSKFTYDLTVDERAYTEFGKKAGEKGVTGAVFARWLGESARVSLEAEKAGSQEVESGLTLFAVEAEGTVRGQSTLPLRASSSGTPLGRAVDVMALGKVLDGFFGGNPIGLLGSPTPAVPADQGPSTFLIVVDGYRRLAVNSGVEALRASRVRTGGIALVAIAGPDPDAVKGTQMARGRGVVQIQPSGLVFVGMRPELLV